MVDSEWSMSSFANLARSHCSAQPEKGNSRQPTLSRRVFVGELRTRPVLNSTRSTRRLTPFVLAPSGRSVSSCSERGTKSCPSRSSNVDGGLKESLSFLPGRKKNE